jgi:hypothetical protein
MKWAVAPVKDLIPSVGGDDREWQLAAFVAAVAHARLAEGAEAENHLIRIRIHGALIAAATTNA